MRGARARPGGGVIFQIARAKAMWPFGACWVYEHAKEGRPVGIEVLDAALADSDEGHAAAAV